MLFQRMYKAQINPNEEIYELLLKISDPSTVSGMITGIFNLNQTFTPKILIASYDALAHPYIQCQNNLQQVVKIYNCLKIVYEQHMESFLPTKA